MAEFRKLAALVVPADARPVIQALQGKVNVFIGLEFDDRKTAVASAG